LRYVIIGNSAAAVGAVEGIRRRDKSGGITIVSDERHHTYSRPLISYYLEGKTDARRMSYRGPDFYEKNGATAMLGETAAAIDAGGKIAELASGAKLPYDKLLIATGSSPVIPRVSGIENVKNRFAFAKYDDALALESALTPKSRLLIAGAGLIGLKCAEGALGRAGSITVVDMAPRVLSSILDEYGASIVQRRLEERGITFLLNDRLKSLTEDAAATESGAEIGFDIIVFAVGVSPNVSLAKAVGCETRRGVFVNDRMETSAPDIYAAGDCTESYDVSSGTVKVMALLPNAYAQGETAGINLAGGRAVFDKAAPLNAIGFFGLRVMTAGTYEGEAFESRGANGDGGPLYKKLFVNGGRLSGFIIIGDSAAVGKAGVYTSLVRERTPLSGIDFGLIRERPGLMAFSRRERKLKLGGEF
jgi:NAD(P)H-nitrite reductase large subunit